MNHKSPSSDCIGHPLQQLIPDWKIQDSLHAVRALSDTRAVNEILALTPTMQAGAELSTRTWAMLPLWPAKQ